MRCQSERAAGKVSLAGPGPYLIVSCRIRVPCPCPGDVVGRGFRVHLRVTRISCVQSKLQWREGQVDAALGCLRGAVELAIQGFGPDAPQSYYVKAQLAIFLR